MYLTTNPSTNQQELHSSFAPRQIRFNHYVVTAFDDHEVLFLEHIGRGNLPETRLIHPVALGEGLNVRLITCQTSRPSGIGGFEFIERRRLPKGARFRCYEADNRQRDLLLKAVEKVRVKISGNRFRSQPTGPLTVKGAEILTRLLDESAIG
jgi:hypothetical protein